MCSDLLAENTSLAAAFKTDCRRCSSAPDTPASVEEQYLTLVITSALSKVSRASRVRERRTLSFCQSAAKQALTVTVMWALNTDVLLMRTDPVGI